MKSILINGAEFSYNEETHYEKDGHVYCKTCNEKADGELKEFLGNKMILRLQCTCEKKKLEEEERRKKQMEQDMLRKNALYLKIR